MLGTFMVLFAFWDRFAVMPLRNRGIAPAIFQNKSMLWDRIEAVIVYIGVGLTILSIVLCLIHIRQQRAIQLDQAESQKRPPDAP